MLIILYEGIRFVSLFRKYKKEQMEEMNAERRQIEEERRANAEMLKEYYELQGAQIKSWCKPECDHHPHGFEDNTELIEYIERVKL